MIYAMDAVFMSRSSKAATDPLSDVLSLLKPRAYKSVGLDSGQNWAFRLEQSDGFMCLALVAGTCWIMVDGTYAPIRLNAGEFTVLPKAPGFCIASDPAVPAVSLSSAIEHWPKGGVVTWQGGGECLLLSALFTFASEHSNVLLEVLPSLLLLDNSVDCTALQWCLQRMMAVLRDPQPGSVLQAEYLAQLMLLEILRLHATEGLIPQIGWLSALADSQLGAAITAMHQAPGHRWTVQQLAQRARMSRSAFAERFKRKAGTSVMGYLVRWRMLLAADRLVTSSDSVASVALSLGYESESAFGFAFEREMGCSPRQYFKRQSATRLRYQG